MKIRVTEKLKEYIVEKKWSEEMYDLIGKTFESEYIVYAPIINSKAHKIMKGRWYIPIDCAEDYKKELIKEILK